MCAIGRPGYCSHRTGVPTIDEAMISIDYVPHLRRVVIPPRSNMCAIGRPGYRFYRTWRLNARGRLEIGEDVPASGGVPDLHGSISICRGDTPTIGRPRHREHATERIKVAEAMTPIGCVPHLHRPITVPTVARLSNALAIGRPRYRCYRLATKPKIGEDIPASGGIPDLHGSIMT